MTDAGRKLAEYLAVADAAFDAANYSDAVTAYTAALAIEADNAVAKYNLAASLTRIGRSHDATRILRRLVGEDAGFAEAAYNLALILHEDGELEEAIDYYQRAIATSPSLALAHRNLGATLRHSDRIDEAIICFERWVELEPDDPEARLALAAILKEAGKLEEAVAAYQSSLELRPDWPIAWFGLGVTLLKASRKEEALAAFDAALAAQPDFAEAHLDRGVILRSLGRDEDAAESYRQALAIRPDYGRARINLADCYQTLGRHADAVVLYREILKRNPDEFDALNNLGVALTALNELDEAVEVLGRAVELRPTEASAQMHLGIALARAAAPNDALRHYRLAVELNPASAPAWSNLGAGLHDLGDFEAAIQCSEQSIAIDPMFAPAHANQGITRLLTGDLAAGWREYEWRLGGDGPPGRLSRADPDDRNGLAELAGKRLLLTAEQGLGDTIQFCRFLGSPRLADVRLVLRSPRPLHGLIGDGFPEVGLVDPGDAPPQVDAQRSLMSLPFLFRTRLETIPAEVPYLRASPAKVARWRPLVPDGRKPRVGLVWAGGSTYANDRVRSLPFASLVTLAARADIQLVSLQKAIPAADRAALDACGTITRLGEQVVDFCDTAAIVASLDLVISADTSVAHLAGALARPVWILLPYIPDWRWLLGRDDSPWYPTARLFRQRVLGDWAGVIDRVGDALGHWVDSWRPDLRPNRR